MLDFCSEKNKVRIADCKYESRQACFSSPLDVVQAIFLLSRWLRITIIWDSSF